MIRSRIGGRESFGDRLRSSRQQLARKGQKLTQGDLARAVGVERNTVSRWENGGMLPKDPAVIASLAGVLEVTADWLIGGERSPATGTELHEGVAGQYLDPAIKELPEDARAIAGRYIDRLRIAGCTETQLRAAESLMLAGARNRVSSTSLDERAENEVCSDIDAAWDMVVHILRREGIRP
jgi:transcriptional regulator with XRE-family HTH domain